MKVNLGVPGTMKVAAMTQEWEHGMSTGQILESVKLAEDLGFHKAMLGEHFIVPNEHIPLSGAHYLHGTVALGVIAGHTSTIKLTSSITILPLQNPIVQAKAWSTLDWLSGGRTAPIFGVGWLKEEFDMLNVDFHRRGKMAEEYIQAMIELWTKDEPNFKGEFVSFSDAGFEPKPAQKGGIPIWFGGDAPAVLARVGRYGNGWSPFQTPPEKFKDALDLIKSQPEYDGRPIDVFFALEMLNVGAHHEIKGDDRAKGAWDANKIIEQCQWLGELGVSETIVPQPPIKDFDAYKDRLRWVSEEIIPKVANT
ncbi:MAG: LLM class F420-dependent oxidoreductase [Porticoccaceae bacterium]|nr:LLM class F420-dependent oxidoreductase [Porticoccaceae bacterium]